MWYKVLLFSQQMAENSTGTLKDNKLLETIPVP